MHHKFIPFILFLVFSTSAFSQVKLSGTVTDNSNRPVPFANVYIDGSTKGTTTNTEGHFEFLNLDPGPYKIVVSIIGFKKYIKSIQLDNDGMELTIALEENSESLDEVIITANRSQESLDEVPSSVTILNSAQIRELAQTSNNIADVLAHVPGIAFSTNKTSNTGQTLRGRKMLVMIDGIPQSTPLRDGSRDINTIDANVIERVEVIKGATAIYGNGADGGIVNYITKKPGINKPFTSSTTLTSQGSLVDIDGTVGASLSQQFSGYVKKLSYVASGSFQQTGIFRDSNGEVLSPTYGLGETTQYNFFGKVGYQFDSKNSIEGMYNYFSSNQNSNYVPQIGEYGTSPTIGIIGESPGVDQGNRFNHNAQITFRSNDLFLNTDLNLNLYLQDFKTVYGYSDFFYNPDGGYEGGQSQIISSKRGVRLNFNTLYGIGNQIHGNVLYGLDILTDKTAQTLVDGRVWVPEMDMRNFAPYVQLKSVYNDFVLKAGIRFENIKIGIDDYQTIYIYPNGGDVPNGGVDVEGGDLAYNATVFNIGLRYNRWDFFKPFVSFSQSFSIADLGRTLRSAQENTVASINSEAVIANNYEVGFNSKIDRIKLSGAIFTSQSDLGSSYKEVDGVFQILRQPEKVYGYELAYDIDLPKNLSAGGSFSYTEGKFDSDNDGSYDNYINSDRIPPFKTTAFIQYKKKNVWDAMLTATFNGPRIPFAPSSGGGYSYGQGPVYAFHIFNLNANYHITQNTRLSLGIENLFNEDYYTPISQWSSRDSDYVKGTGARATLGINVTL